MPANTPRPTQSELRILAVLWRSEKPCTVREVHRQLGADSGYTTVLKFMQLMTDKGLLRRRRAGRSHVYRPAVPQQHMQKRLVTDLIHKAFGGSLRKLLVAALSGERASGEDLDEIRKLIDHAEARRRSDAAHAASAGASQKDGGAR
jgi:predicted transcriptional regulator